MREFLDCVRSAHMVVAHAGMGTILTALQYGTPIVVMPRLARYREMRNDHQVDTVKMLHGRKVIMSASTSEELHLHLDQWESATANARIGSTADPILLDTIRGALVS
jgi:UDP-N-acetylglucosamine transferase subunit ALG13